MERETIHGVYLWSSKGGRSVIVLTDASNSKMNGYVKDCDQDIGYVLRQLEMDGYRSKILYDSNIEPEDVFRAIGYSISYDVAGDTEEFDRGKNWLFKYFKMVLSGSEAKVIEEDEDYMVVSIDGCIPQFIVTIEEG